MTKEMYSDAWNITLWVFYMVAMATVNAEIPSNMLNISKRYDNLKVYFVILTC